MVFSEQVGHRQEFHVRVRLEEGNQNVLKNFCAIGEPQKFLDVALHSTAGLCATWPRAKGSYKIDLTLKMKKREGNSEFPSYDVSH